MRYVQWHPCLSVPRKPNTGQQRAPKTPPRPQDYAYPVRAAVAAPGADWRVARCGCRTRVFSWSFCVRESRSRDVRWLGSGAVCVSTGVCCRCRGMRTWHSHRVCERLWYTCLGVISMPLSGGSNAWEHAIFDALVGMY
eukprot:5627773-Prymnesium_polylepis.2